MLNAIINWSLEHRFLVIVGAIGLVLTGAYSVRHLPVDAFPDTTPVQVQINTVAPALSPEEIEQQITFPVEQAISGLKDLKEVRSLSKFGLSQVTIIFGDGIDIYFARQLVMERLTTVELPEGLPSPTMGPVATGLGEVFHYIRSDGSNRPVRHKVRAPSFMNVPTNCETVPGYTVADATIILAAVDPCYCCTERMAVAVDRAGGERLWGASELIRLSCEKTWRMADGTGWTGPKPPDF